MPKSVKSKSYKGVIQARRAYRRSLAGVLDYGEKVVATFKRDAVVHGADLARLRRNATSTYMDTVVHSSDFDYGSTERRAAEGTFQDMLDAATKEITNTPEDSLCN